jgi:tRNA (cytidine56-2'-O)-methyltransferase
MSVNEKKDARMSKIFVFRLNHRPIRDKRVTTHLFLAARAFGADGGIYSGKRDLSIEKKLEEVVSNWGGNFEIKYIDDWKKVIHNKDSKVIHLTMYGLPIQDVISEIRKEPAKKLVIVGGAKVRNEIYKFADWNVAVTSQPHSEISALAIFLHEFFEHRELRKIFRDSRIRIIPQSHGKQTENIRT